jgi:dihydropteroate synthase
LKIGTKEFNWSEKTFVMGILNVTPDSFSDGGKFDHIEDAMKQVEKMIVQGVDIIDVGGESTRPGHEQISIEEEIKRVVPVILAIKEKWDVPVSIDTYKSEVADAAFIAGADLLNDIWGLTYDEKMASIAKKHKVPVCLMHNRKEAKYGDFMTDVINDLMHSVSIAHNAGIPDDAIILDPGVGFAKDYKQNLIVMRHVDEIVKLGYPVLFASSRKSVIGNALDLPVDQREEGTLTTSVWAAMKGCQMVRVHDVEKNVRALKMLDAIRRA